jgi:hypothetical protein
MTAGVAENIVRLQRARARQVKSGSCSYSAALSLLPGGHKNGFAVPAGSAWDGRPNNHVRVTVLDSLPSRPLKRGDIEQLRTRETVDGFIALESRAHVANGGLRKAVALTERTVVDLEFEDGAWQQTVLARDADSQDHLNEALGQLDGH